MQKILSPSVAPALAAALAAGCLAVPIASAQGVSPAQQKQLEQMIEEIDEKLNGGTARNNSRALSTLQAIAGDPKSCFEFYMEATKELDFDAQGKREVDWREWRDRNEDRLKSTEHMAALQYQVRYLLLTMQVALEKDESAGLTKVLPTLIDYYDELAGNYEKLDDQQRVLTSSALNSVFARKLKLDLTLPKLERWSNAPLPVGAVYDGVILPHFREARNHEAIEAAWDKRIMHESQMIELGSGQRAAGFPGRGPGRGFRRDDRDREREERREETRQREQSIEEFKTVRLPELQWGKHRDALFYGNDQGAALIELGRILRDNITHPQAQQWLAELKTLAKGGWNRDTYYNVPEEDAAESE